MGPITQVLSSSAHLSGDVDADGNESITYIFEYSTDKVAWNEAGRGSLPGTGAYPVSVDVTGLKAGTKYFVRLTAVHPGEEVTSSEPYAEFETVPADPPAVASVEASSVQGTVAKASGEVERPEPGNPDPGLDAQCNFEYIEDAQFLANEANSESGFSGAAQAGCNHNPVKAADSPQVSAKLTGLNPGTTYHLRLSVSNAGGSDVKVASTFTTLTIPKPTVSLNPFANLTATGATFSAKIDPGAVHGDDPGFEVRWHFECQPACLDLSQQSGSFADDGVEHEVKTDATLEPNTPYTIKVVAENFSGSESDEDSFHTIKGVPVALTVPAFALEGGTSALLGARINPNKSPSTYWFEWGSSDCSTSSCQETSHLPANANEVQGLSIVANTGTFNVTFRGLTTADLPFNVSAEGLRSALEGLSTIGTGNVSVSLSSGTYRITFIGDLAGTELPQMSAESGATPLENGENEARATVKTITDGGFYTGELTGLTPGSTYHFRVSAENAQGVVHGGDLTFTTPPPAEPPVSCPNAAFRTGSSAALPDCRAYENLTSLNLLGARTYAINVAENGEAAVWETTANLPGFESTGVRDTYVGKRTSNGWTSTIIGLPGNMTQPFYGTGNLEFASANLDGPFVWRGLDVINPEDPDPTKGTHFYEDLYRRETDGSFVWLTRGSDMAPAGSEAIRFLGASSDGLTVYFTNEGRRLEPDAPNGGVYIRSGQTTSVIKDKNEVPVPVLSPLVRGSDVSDDGSVLAFACFDAGVLKLYVYTRDRGYAVPVSDFSGGPGISGSISLSSDGSRLFFSTTGDLTSGDDDGGANPYIAPSDIYEYEVSTGDLTRLSGMVAGPGPGNGNASANLVLASPDGSAVYFTSIEQLDGSKGLRGAPNLYRAEGGAIHYALTLTGEPHGPRLSGDGKKLLFQSSDRLTAYDNVGRAEIYVYDSADGSTVCVSCRPNGEAPSGDAGFGDANFAGAGWSGARPMSSDQHGERIFFQSSDEVLPQQDVNGEADVYEFDASSGTPSLISTGESPAPSYLGGNSADGRDVFFTTLDSLLPHDQNVGTQKVFDARIDGGFPDPPAPAVCEGEGCRGASSGKPAEVAPTTSSFSGSGNPKPKAKKHKKHKRAKKHQSKSHKKHQSHKRDVNRDGRTGR